MAVVSGGQVVLNNGQRVTPQTGGWYDGQQFFAGSLSAPGQFNAANNQPGQQGGAAPVQNSADAAYLASRGDASAPQRVVSQPQQQPQSSGMATGAGIQAPQGPPAFDLIGATNAAYNTPEITAAGQAITSANSELTQRQTALASAQAEINDNPFYSEATRVGKSAKLNDQANADMTIIQNKITQAQQQEASLKSDAAIKVNAAMGQYNINNQQYQQNLQQFNTMLSAGALTNASPQDLATMAVSTGIPVSELLGIQQKQKQENVKPQMVTANDGTISIIDLNTGQIISKSTPGVGPVAKKTGGSPKNSDKADMQNTIIQVNSLLNSRKGSQGYVSKEDWAKVKQAAINAGMTPAEFNSNFSSFTNPGASKAGYVYN